MSSGFVAFVLGKGMRSRRTFCGKIFLTFVFQKYIVIMEDKSEVNSVSPRTGRPTDNPKTSKITVRLDSESAEIMQKYCEQEGIEKAEAVRRGLKKLEADIKK